MTAADDPKDRALLLDATTEPLEALRRAALLAERLAARASLTADEARDVRHEIQTVRDDAERMEAMITPPMEYLLAWRMAVAKDLLRRQELALAEVAERVGHGSASTFSTAFSRRVGQSPSRYAASVRPPSTRRR